ncbi:unnamed protein product, partial [Closterium sp. Naga37s-1]
ECVAGVQSWEAHAEKLEAPRSTCSYLVWYEPQTRPSVAQRLLSLLSAFLYALLTHRALLVDTHGDLPSLLCNPFPRSSWWLPAGLPEHFRLHPPHQGEWVNGSTSNQYYAPLNRRDVATIYFEEQRYAWDEQFFCTSMQAQLARNATWLAMLCDQHLLPSLFLLPAFHRPLHRLFPSRVLLHPLARYLLLPANAVWERALRAHQGHLAHAWRSVGVQLASGGSVAMKEAMREQALECGMSQGVLPLPLAPSQLAAFLNHSSRARHLSLSSRSLLDGGGEEGGTGRQGEGQVEGKGAGKGEGAHKKAGRGEGSNPQRRQFGLFSRPLGGEARAPHKNDGKRGAGVGASGQSSGETSSFSHDAAATADGGGAREGELGSSGGRVVRGRARARVVAVFVAADSFAAFKFFKRAYAQWPTEDHSVVAVHAEVEDDSEERLLSANQMELLRIWLLSTCQFIIARSARLFVSLPSLPLSYSSVLRFCILAHPTCTLPDTPRISRGLSSQRPRRSPSLPALTPSYHHHHSFSFHPNLLPPFPLSPFSPASAEGYLASGLAGRPPFLLSPPLPTTATTESHHGDPATAAEAAAAAATGGVGQGGCTRSWSTEGCHLGAPLSLICSSYPHGDGSAGVRERGHRSTDPARWLPFLRRCADHAQGLTLLPKLTHPDP